MGPNLFTASSREGGRTTYMSVPLTISPWLPYITHIVSGYNSRMFSQHGLDKVYGAFITWCSIIRLKLFNFGKIYLQ